MRNVFIEELILAARKSKKIVLIVIITYSLKKLIY